MSQFLEDLQEELACVNLWRAEPPQPTSEKGELIGGAPDTARRIFSLRAITGKKILELLETFFLGCRHANPKGHYCLVHTPLPPELQAKIGALDSKLGLLNTLFWEEIYASFPEELADRPRIFIDEGWAVYEGQESEEETNDEDGDDEDDVEGEENPAAPQEETPAEPPNENSNPTVVSGIFGTVDVAPPPDEAANGKTTPAEPQRAPAEPLSEESKPDWGD